MEANQVALRVHEQELKLYDEGSTRQDPPNFNVLVLCLRVAIIGVVGLAVHAGYYRVCRTPTLESVGPPRSSEKNSNAAANKHFDNLNSFCIVLTGLTGLTMLTVGLSGAWVAHAPPGSEQHADTSPSDGATAHYASSKCSRWKAVVPQHDNDVIVIQGRLKKTLKSKY